MVSEILSAEVSCLALDNQRESEREREREGEREAF
jgi:hypothetical protein